MFIIKPEKLNSSEKSFKFTEISEFISIDELKSAMIEKEVETVLRESHIDQFAYIERKLDNTPLRKLSAWKNFVEITERRNLFVHKDGIISRHYLAKCKENGVSSKENHKPGDRLTIDRMYLNSSIDCFFEIGLKLGYVMWRKTTPNESEDADQFFLSVTFDMIQRGRYKLALDLLDLIFESPNHTKNIELVAKVNAMQCHKWMKNTKILSSMLSDFDTDVLEHKFKIARAVLEDDFVRASSIMLEIPDSQIKKDEYLTWPFFMRFRESAEFSDTYFKKYGEQPFIEEKIDIIKNSKNMIGEDSQKSGDIIDENSSTQINHDINPEKKRSRKRKTAISIIG